MCETSERALPSSPRWTMLYALTLPPLASLIVVEAVPMPDVVREAVRCVLTLVAFAGMAFWVRRNRVALDLAQGCECTAQDLTVCEARDGRPVAPIALPAPRAVVGADDETLVPR